MNKLYISNVKNGSIWIKYQILKRKKDIEISVIKHKCQNLKS